MSAWMRGDASLPHAELANTLRETRTVMMERSDPFVWEQSILFHNPYIFAMASGPDDIQDTLKAVLMGISSSFPLAMSCLFDVCKSVRTADSTEFHSVTTGIEGIELHELARSMTVAQDSGRAAELAEIKKFELLQLMQDEDAYMATARKAMTLKASASARRDRMKEVFEKYWPGLSMPSSAAELASFAADNKADSK
jgi:hypothetical protein